MKSIVVKPETYKRLAHLRIEMGFRSFDEVINFLLSEVKVEKVRDE